MTRLRQWLHHRARQENGAFYLDVALLGNRFWGYSYYRLRYFFLRLGIETSTHTIQFALLYRFFAHSDFLTIVLLHAVSGLLRDFWWGYLEEMRERVRLLYRSGKPRLIPQEIGRWLSLSAQLSILAAVMGGLFTFLHIRHERYGPRPVDLYLMAVCMRLSVDFTIRCYHSGIYALRRVYRPPLAIVVIEVLGFVVILASWPWFGTWSLPAAVMVSTAVATVLSLHYVGRAYRFYRFAPWESVSLRWRWPLHDGSAGGAVAAGFSYTVMYLDSLLTLALFGTKSGLSSLLFLLGPLSGARIRWAQLFYFDLKRLDVSPFRSYRSRFENHIALLSMVLSVLFWAWSDLIVALGYGKAPSWSYWLMLPFFFSRSMLAGEQIRAFSAGAYRRLLEASALFPVGLGLMRLFLNDDRAEILFLSLLAFVVFGLLRIRQGAAQPKDGNREVVSPSQWLAWAKEARGPIRIAAVQFEGRPEGRGWEDIKRWHRITQSRQRELGKRIAGRLDQVGSVTLSYPARIVWYEQAGGPSRVDEEWLVAQAGGLLRFIDGTRVQFGGLAALEAAHKQGLLGDDLSGAWSEVGRALCVGEVRRLFLGHFPQGIVYDPEGPTLPMLRGLSPKELRKIMFDAAAFARDARATSTCSLFDVTAFIVGGELRLILLVDRQEAYELRSQWRAIINRINLQTALASAVLGKASTGQIPCPAGERRASDHLDAVPAGDLNLAYSPVGRSRQPD